MDFKTFLCCLFAHVTFLLHQWVLNSTAISILVQLWLGLCNYVKAVSFIRFYFPLTFHPLVFIIFLSGAAGMSVRHSLCSFAEAKPVGSDAKVSLERRTRQAAGGLMLRVPAVSWHAGCGQGEGLGEALRGRSWLELCFKAF